MAYQHCARVMDIASTFLKAFIPQSEVKQISSGLDLMRSLEHHKRLSVCVKLVMLIPDIV